MSRSPASKRRTRRGVYTLLLSTGAMLGIAAAAIDVSFALVARSDLQAAADAASHGAALVLNGTAAGVDHARSRARLILSEHRVYGQAIDLASSEIVFGYEDDTGFVVSTDVDKVDTAKVVAKVPKLPLLIAGKLLNKDSIALKRRANGRAPNLAGASSIPCYLPLAVPACLFDRHSRDKMPAIDIVLNPAGIDNAGWGRIAGHPNASWTRDMIRDCRADGPATIADIAGLTNGEMTDALSEIGMTISKSTTTWDSKALGALPARMTGSAVPAWAYGRTLERPILVFDGGPGYCAGMGGSYNEDVPLVGFSWAIVYDVRPTGKASEKTVRMRVNPNVQKIETRWGGGPEWGIYAKIPARLVE